jgi:DNA-binding NtrC family response regulator
VEDSVPAADASNESDLRAWRCLDCALRGVVHPRDGADPLPRFLRLAAEAGAAERAFLVRSGGASRAVAPTWTSSGSPGDRPPSRTALARALTLRGPLVCLDVERDAALSAASVRSLRLRSILGAPIPVAPPERAALLLDSRFEQQLAPSTLGRIRESFAALAALVLKDADRARPAGASPSAAGLGEYPSAAHGRMRAWVRSVAPTELPVVVRGESGSGKEAVARAVHALSRRSEGPFVAINSTALAETLLEAELFGATRGSYTGADRDRHGLFRLANRGTLFLDELGDMPAALQSKLLRVLDQGHVRPLGSSEETAVDVRVVGATNRDLEGLVKQDRFRADLYHRLTVLQVHVPPLRERLEDLEALVGELADRLARETGGPVPALDSSTWLALRAHSWPGNVRELHAVLARGLLLAAGGPIQPGHLGILPDEEGGPPRDDAASLESAMIRAALLGSGGELTRAAERIGWTRQKLSRRIRALAIDPPRARAQAQGCGTMSSDSSTFQ